MLFGMAARLRLPAVAAPSYVCAVAHVEFVKILQSFHGRVRGCNVEQLHPDRHGTSILHQLVIPKLIPASPTGRY